MIHFFGTRFNSIVTYQKFISHSEIRGTSIIYIKILFTIWVLGNHRLCQGGRVRHAVLVLGRHMERILLLLQQLGLGELKLVCWDLPDPVNFFLLMSFFSMMYWVMDEPPPSSGRDHLMLPDLAVMATMVRLCGGAGRSGEGRWRRVKLLIFTWNKYVNS